MRTANVSSVRSAIQEYYYSEDSDWLDAGFDLVPRVPDPHVLEHEVRAAELLDDHDDDAAWIHQVLGQNMKRSALSAN
jgi:hypothetical protein